MASPVYGVFWPLIPHPSTDRNETRTWFSLSPWNLPIKFCKNPSTIFLVIVVTDRQTHKPTPVKTYSLAFAGRKICLTARLTTERKKPFCRWHAKIIWPCYTALHQEALFWSRWLLILYASRDLLVTSALLIKRRDWDAAVLERRWPNRVVVSHLFTDWF